MRLITIDNGNTNAFAAVHEGGEIKSLIPLANYIRLPDDFLLISNVGKPLALRPNVELKDFRSDTHFFDMPVNYSKSLGEDRLVAAYAIYKKLIPNEKILLIDAGTFMTCDFITSKGFMGGFIFPGVERFLKSYAQSAQLPYHSPDDFSKSLKLKNAKLPKNTDEAILSASQIYFESVLKDMIKKHSPSKIIITGGSAEDIGKLINSEVRFELVHHLIHSALRLIYDLHLQVKI